jgi:hypothetical protein
MFMRADAQPGEDLARGFIRFTPDGRFLDQGLVTTVVSSAFSSDRPNSNALPGTAPTRSSHTRSS